MSDQISRLRMSGIQASVIKANESNRFNENDNSEFKENMDDMVEIDFWLCEEKKLREGHNNIVFAHPETLVSSNIPRTCHCNCHR